MAAEQALPEISDAQLDAIMALKLRRLDSEYAACVNATRSQPPPDETTAAVRGDHDDDDASTHVSTAERAEYARVSSRAAPGDVAAAMEAPPTVAPDTIDGADAAADDDDDDDDDDGGEDAGEAGDAPPPPVRTVAPMDADRAASIRSIMAAAVPAPANTPAWAVGLDDAAWTAHVRATLDK